MRLATIVATDYRASAGLAPLPAAPALATAVQRRLALPAAGFAIARLEGHRELPEALAAHFEGLPGRVASVLFYFAGYVVWQEGRAPALALDAARPRAFPLPRLCALLDRCCDEYLLVLDVALPADGVHRETVADALARVVGDHSPRASGLLSVAAAPPAAGAGALSEHFVAELDALARAGSPSVAHGLFGRLQAGAAQPGLARALRVVPAAPEFPLLASLATDRAAVRARAVARDSLTPAPPSALDPAVVAYQGELARRAAALAASGDYAALAETYAALLETPGAPSAGEVARWLVAYYRSVGGEPWLGVRALERAVATETTDTALRLELADACEAAGQSDLAIDHARAAVAAAPREPGGYRRLATLLVKAGERDRAWVAASALVELGGADDYAAEFVAAHRPAGLLSATSTLSDAHWQRWLAPPVRFAALEQVLETVSESAIDHQLEQLARQRKSPVLDPGSRQDPKTSTTTLGRSLTWTARLFGLPAPELYVEASEQASMQALPLRQPTTRVSKAFASGLSLPELAFVWGRHLTYFRPEYSIFVFYPTLDAMTDLLMAALWAGDWDPKRLRGEDVATSRLAAHLNKVLEPEQREKLRACTQNLTAARGRRRVRSYTEGIDRVANRAGLVACGDLGVAARMIQRFPVETAVEDPVADLLEFAQTAPYAELRTHLGVAIDRQR